ncbi:response regulator transcription factor [Variovorax sp. OV329]|uniref:response regulator transcription factor n=1 Tax=Variovorax sp. OV329 TaxID=1882825 RepID=UPI0008F13ADB|nr:response regulator transcription factor [Variovorax sp. OV329]SFM68703.1 two component transcriptional regulator, LuxR family [Variovorax sp. OV329]
MTTTPTHGPRLQVAVAHQDPYVAAGISALLRSQMDLLVHVGEPSDCTADVLVTDYEAALRRAEAGASVRRPARMPVSLIVTDQVAGWQVRRAVDAGIRGYMLQDCTGDELAEAVRSVGAGRRYLSPLVAEHLLDALSYDVPTARQLEVLKLIALGLSNKDISRRLGIGERTVKTHVKAILGKLGERTRTAAMAEAMRRGMLGEGRRRVALPAGA